MEGNSLQIDVREEEVLTTPDVEVSGTAKACLGCFEIEALHGCGMVKDKVTGEKGIFYEVEWKRSLVRAEDVFSDLPCDNGLAPRSLKLPQAHDEEGREDPEPDFDCRWCFRMFFSKSSQRRHEQQCIGPGGPKHKCPDYCLEENNCPGQKDYIPRKDGRIGNSKGKRGPKPKKNKTNE